MSALLLVFVTALTAQAGEPPPPPPPLDEVPVLPAPAPASEDAPEDDDGAPPVLQPKREAARRPTAAPEPDGLDPLFIGALQWGVPCATAVVAAPCLLLAAYGCPAIVCVPCILPAANGYLAAFVGDRFGKSRAPAIWPVLAAYGAGLATSVAALTAFVLLSPALAGGFNDPVVLGGIGVAALLASGASLAVPVAYYLTAEPKRPGDDGSEVPGWFAPNHPMVKPKKNPTREPTDAPPRLTAMRF